jgi:hypothetical protein
LVSLNRITEPEGDLFTVLELKSLLRVTANVDSEDELIAGYRDAAVEWVEGVCGCSVMKQQWQLGLDRFPVWGYSIGRRDNDRMMDSSYYLPRPIVLPRGPASQVDSIEYDDVDGNVQQYGSFTLDKDSKPPAVYPVFGTYFPVARYAPNSVRVKYTAGMSVDAVGNTDADNVRKTTKMAVRFLISHWYDSREPVPVDVDPKKLPYGLETMLWASRVWRFDWEKYYSYWHS